MSYAESVKAAANGQWPSVLAALGISVGKTNRHSACPGCGGSDRFVFKDKAGEGTFYCSTGGEEPAYGDGIDLVAHVTGCTTAEAIERVASVVGVSKELPGSEMQRLLNEGREREARNRAAEEEATARRVAAATKEALALLAESVPVAEGHPYLLRKGLDPVGLREVAASHVKASWMRLKGGSAPLAVSGRCLLRALRDSEGVKNVEIITEGGEKIGLPGGVRRGLFSILKGNEKGLILCEGWATGVSLNMATGITVVVCSSANNILAVADSIASRGKAIEAPIIIGADNDPAGARYTQKAAERLGAILIFPDNQGEDWDDVRRTLGLDAIAQRIHAPVPQPAPEPANELEPSREVVESDAVDYTEDYLADRFEALNADRFMYVPRWGAWYMWNGAHWEVDEIARHANTMRMMCRGVAKELEELASMEDKPESKLKSARIVSGVKTQQNAIKLLQGGSLMAVSSSEIDNDPWLLATPGGTVDLRTGELRAARQGDRITKSVAVTPADSVNAAPMWIDFLDWATGQDAEMLLFLQRAVGYALTGVIREHSLMFLHGSGGNGKGLFLNALQGIMGEYAKTATMNIFTESRFEQHSTDMAMLVGARLVCAQETQEGRSWDKQKVTQLTGGDPITARFMRQDNFTFLPTFKIFISGNHKPNLRNVDESMRRRLHLIPFTQSLSNDKRDPDLPEKLKKEWPGILRWMIDGCLEWQRIGLAPPASVTDATRGYLDSEDSLQEWIDECCHVGTSYRVRAKALFMSWGQWCEENALPPGNIKSFIKSLEGKGFVKRIGAQNKTEIEGIAALEDIL